MGSPKEMFPVRGWHHTHSREKKKKAAGQMMSKRRKSTTMNNDCFLNNTYEERFSVFQVWITHLPGKRIQKLHQYSSGKLYIILVSVVLFFTSGKQCTNQHINTP
ncbi:hypothetical protein CRENBAI_000391 [Crenichthys baileyi]|uniref:Uncharacterized protein n=1 Tax=Crenichthys baileyi TaxID=28760 RepID=A0AAV9RVU8_9TELE